MKARINAIGTLALACFAGAAMAQDGTVYVSGLPHSPTGAATFLAPTGRRLPVRNIGSSGQDGVEVQLNSMYGGTVGIDLTPIVPTAGASVRVRYRGWDGLIYGNHRLINNGGGSFTSVFDFSSINAQTVNVKMLSETGQVISDVNYPGPIVEMPWVPNWYCADGSIPVYWSGYVTLCNSCAPVFVAGWACPNSGGVFSFNDARMIVTPGGNPGGPTLPPVGALDLSADGVTGFDAIDTSLHTFGQAIWGVGQAQIDEECTPDAATGACDPTVRRLPVRNLGSSGQDGVAIDLGPDVGGVSLQMSKGCCRGHVTLMKLTDDEGQEERISQNITDMDPTGATTVELDADFGAASPGFALTLYGVDGNVLGPSGGVFIYNGGPRPVWTNRCPPGSTEIWTNTGTTGNPVWTFQGCNTNNNMTVPGGTSYSGVTSYSITPIGPVQQGKLRHVVITKNGSEMELRGLTTTPSLPQCGSADFNGDGDIGTDADIEAFFACLAGNCCPTCDPHHADFNGDGDIGTDRDIESFFSVLAGGPC